MQMLISFSGMVGWLLSFDKGGSLQLVWRSASLPGEGSYGIALDCFV